MNQDEQKPCCVNCHISGVPLYLGLDGKQHCADHIGLLLPDFPKQETKPVRKTSYKKSIPQKQNSR